METAASTSQHFTDVHRPVRRRALLLFVIVSAVVYVVAAV
jgi:hypothetical protein